MIIGNGMLAKRFKKYKKNHNIIIFASGVSNSKEMNIKNYDREKNLLNDTISHNQDKLLVYFSTCSLEDKSQQDSKYIMHKKNMEELIQSKCKNYYIFRLPQVVGQTKSPTLVNFLIYAIQNDIYFEVQKNATRNLIDVDDVFKISDKIITDNIFMNEIVNVASPFNIKVIDIVRILEKILGKKAKFEFVNKGCAQNIKIDKIKFSNSIFYDKYVENILLKRALS